MKQITILVAEDHSVVREGFLKMLSLETDFRVVGEARNGRQAVSQTQKLKPDVILMDLAMPELNGMEATRQIVDSCPGAKILVLSAYDDDVYLFGAVDAGALGFLLKQEDARQLCLAVREVSEGRRFFSPAITGRLNRLQSRVSGRALKKGGKKPKLTMREAEVLQLIAEGKTNKEISTVLQIASKTVEKHRANVLKKLDVHDTARLTRYAMSSGAIEPTPRL